MKLLGRVAMAIICSWVAQFQSVDAQGINRRGFLTAGEGVPALKGFGLDSKPIVIDYRAQGKPTVVYVISERGGAFVDRNEANFAALVKQAGSRYAFVIVCPEDTGSLASTIERMRPAWGAVPVAVVANVGEELRQAMTLFAYPQTIVISTEARVIENFHGAYIRTSSNANPGVIERFFGVKLPEIER